MSLSIAADHGTIPVTNLRSMPPLEVCHRLRDIISFCPTFDASRPVWESE